MASAPQLGDRVAAAASSYRSAHLRVGTVEKLHPKSGQLTIRTDEGTAHVVRASGVLVINCPKEADHG